MLKVNLWNQGDPRWGSKRLGTATSSDGRPLTMATHGCYVTSVAMILANFGKDVTPGQLCDGANAINGFTPDGQLKWDAIEALYPDVIFHDSQWTTRFYKARDVQKIEQPEALRRLMRLLELGFPALLCVDYPGVNEEFRADHAVVLVDAPRDASRPWKVYDPAGGTEVLLTDKYRYGVPADAVYGYRVLVGPPIGFPEETSRETMGLGLAAWKAAMTAAGRHVATYSREIILHILNP